MTAEGAREFDFTWTVRFAAAGFVIVMLVWIGTLGWTQTDQPRWLVVVGAAVIAVGMVVYARIAWWRLVRRATLDERRPQVVTASGQEHAIDVADIVIRGLPHFGEPNSLPRLHHPGGRLYVLPPGDELVERLLTAGARR